MATVLLLFYNLIFQKWTQFFQYNLLQLYSLCPKLLVILVFFLDTFLLLYIQI
jgi:hypothetical protein